MNITTAVILAGGLGTRMLPVTAAVQKELLPILNRPVIDYVVADCVSAGITRIIFVVRPGSHGLQDYYLGNADLTAHLTRRHNQATLDQLAAIHHQATFEFIEQSDELGYGTAVPVMTAAAHLTPHEAFLVCGGDDFLWHPNGQSETAALIRTFGHAQAAVGALMALERPTADLHRYGVLAVHERDRGVYLRTIVEKPQPGQAPSNLINISKYILTPTLLRYVQQVQPDPRSGEYLITDAFQAAAQNHNVAVHAAQGQFLDAGTVATWLEANRILAQNQT